MQDSNSRKSWSIGKLAQTMGRLFRDNAGNTIAIIGAALIPITAMIGSGVDISRAYMAKSRMQSACDSASLAARRVMKNDTLNDTVTDTGKQFFDFNFPQGLYQTAEFEPSVTRPGTGLIRVSANTTIPTTIMRVFGFTDLPLSVSCEASLNFVNTDVVLVLDVTGSMADSLGGTAKIQSLRDAVMALYDELAPIQAQLKTQGLRLRYGVVPYSGTVNVGRLVYAKDASYIRSSTPYQSRVANYTTATTVYTANAPTLDSEAWEIAGSSQSTGDCENWTKAAASSTGTAPTATITTSYSANQAGTAYAESTNWGWTGASDTNGSTKSCRRWKKVTRTTYQTPGTTRYKFTNWTYQKVDLDTSIFKTPGGTLSMSTGESPVGTSATSRSYNMQELANIAGVSKADYTWNGCIEERDTVSTITASSGFTIPSGAYDLNINLIPNNDATRWRPMLKDSIYKRTAGSATATSGSTLDASAAYWACPYESRRLDEWERQPLLDYVNLLQPIGGTYHDIGMIWGARLISTGGIFADGCEEYNGMPCNRHIIFMTDDAQTAYCTENVYTAWGLEPNDMRVTGAGTCPNQLDRHKQRFQMICNATKNMNVSVWVVAFGTSLNASLTACASNSSQAKTSANRDQLIAQFREIGNQIGALRLTE